MSYLFLAIFGILTPGMLILLPKTHRLFFIIFSLSTLYYGILGPWYWLTNRNGTFIGVDWSDAIGNTPIIFLCIQVLVFSVLFFLSKGSRSRLTFKTKRSNDSRIVLLERIFLAIGTISALYVFVRGGSVVSGGGMLTDDGALQIAYQFSDLVIAVLIFRFADLRFSHTTIAAFALFIVYAAIVGMRYKILILAAPILIFFYFSPHRNQILTRTAMIFGAIIMVAAFSAMTIARQKFVGIDFDAISAASFDDFLYGLFADTNIIFGLSSALEEFGNNSAYVGFQPIIDSFVQFIPRALYPEKNLYQHLVSIQWGLGGTTEALSSGTAPPFFGEYYAMAGWPGVVIGCCIYTALIHFLIQVSSGLQSKRHSLVSLSLIAVYFGYYYFSRGSVAQIFKGFIFICLPYLYLANARRTTERSPLQATPRLA